MSRRVLISHRAEADLREIWHYTAETWDESQADRYLDALADGMQICGLRPQDGTNRDAIRRGYWSARLRKHVIFYTVDETSVIIQRVLHGSQDHPQHL